MEAFWKVSVTAGTCCVVSLGGDIGCLIGGGIVGGSGVTGDRVVGCGAMGRIVSGSS
jgi:hypothetical protein